MLRNKNIDQMICRRLIKNLVDKSGAQRLLERPKGDNLKVNGYKM
jgi:hypothetical protein